MNQRAVAIAVITVMACGCSTPSKPATPAPAKPVVAIVTPEKRDIVRVVGQPGFVDSYERAALYAKVSGYIEKWNVDIGDIVKKDQVLATIFVPELVEEHRVKQATVELDTVLVDQARKVADSADGARALEAAVAKYSGTDRAAAIATAAGRRRYKFRRFRLRRNAKSERRTRFQPARSAWTGFPALLDFVRPVHRGRPACIHGDAQRRDHTRPRAHRARTAVDQFGAEQLGWIDHHAR